MNTTIETGMTKVKFFKHEKDNEVYAVFIDDVHPYNYNLLSGYAHIGQHTMINRAYIAESIHAKKEEYMDLYNELTNLVGYNLKVENIDFI